MREVKIKYALRIDSDLPAYIYDVENGLKCDCYCAECKGKFEAVQGKSEKPRQWHFRHAVKNSNCIGGVETVLHKRAKIMLVGGECLNTKQRGNINYVNAIAEIEVLSLRPDVSAEFNGQPIYFEVARRHFIEPEKRQLITEQKLRCIEIDLSKLSSEPTDEELKKALFYYVNNKEIIYWENEVIDDQITLLENTSISNTALETKPSWLHNLFNDHLPLIIGAVGLIVGRMIFSNSNNKQKRLRKGRMSRSKKW